VQVVAVTPLYPPGSRVGAWLATHEALRHLHSRGHSVSALRYLTNGPAYVHEGVHVTGAALLEQNIRDADVVIAHLGDDGRAQHLSRRHGKPFVRMIHGWCPDAQEKLRGCDLAVFNSEAARAEFGNGERSIVVHPVTREDEHRTAPGDRVTLVNLSPVKGGELFRLLALSFPAVPFLGVRGGWGRQELHRMPGNVDVIRMTVNMREDVWARTRVLLMPSDRETWGMVGVEALASGIPVIAADRPGLRESLSSGAYTFLEPADLSGWQEAVTALQEPDAWAFASLRARARFEELRDGFTPGLDLFAEEVEALCG
jgi:glycosyltransferase involved in cell wall biosynthesis